MNLDSRCWLQRKVREIGQQDIFRKGETWNATRPQTVSGQDDHSGFDEGLWSGGQGNRLSANGNLAGSWGQKACQDLRQFGHAAIAKAGHAHNLAAPHVE
jgi:hypothetical protein